jgi:hypothetical protein
MADQRGERVAMHILVSKKARDGLNQFAAELGITLTALAEVFGQMMLRGEFNVNDYPELIERVPQAKQIDSERRRRGEPA